MAELRPLEKIFSITNSGTDKLVMLFGIPIKIDRTKYFKNKCKNLKIQKNKIVFCNFKGAGFGCNPKYIVEEIIKRKLPYELVWLVRDVNSELEKGTFPEQIRLVPIYKKDALIELATAKLWVDNQRKNYFIKKGLMKKDNQCYIQTWHGSLGIKKVGIDSPLTQIENAWIPYGKIDAEMMDYVISNSRFETEVFKTNFWGNGNINLFGHPRNDIFFKPEEEKQKIKDKVFTTLQIDKNKKVLLYVPSFRDDKRLSCYGLDTSAVANALKDKFGGDWIIAIRMHPRIKKYSQHLFYFNENTIDATDYPDIQELLLASDIAITDYSSCIFDFMLSRKPGFIFATDIEQYNTDRGFYYPLESTPFPIATNNYELIKNIENFDYEEYKQKVEDFLKDKGCMEDGHASERVVDLIEKIMSGEVDE